MATFLPPGDLLPVIFHLRRVYLKRNDWSQGKYAVATKGVGAEEMNALTSRYCGLRAVPENVLLYWAWKQSLNNTWQHQK